MATAGSGDILSGIIASLVAQGFSSPKAAIARQTSESFHGYQLIFSCV
jgi:NAD(P)H-hydrate repair Nnr-like enzyme with NAD(P)H-hydrate dehydratase domain